MMSEIMNEIYYMIEERTGQELLDDEEVKNLEARREALWDEVIHRLGEGGEEIREVIKNLDLELDTIYEKALFRAALRLGALIVRPKMENGRTGKLSARQFKATGR